MARQSGAITASRRQGADGRDALGLGNDVAAAILFCGRLCHRLVALGAHDLDQHRGRQHGHTGDHPCGRVDAVALADLAEQFLDNFDRWEAGEPLLNVVDKNLGYVPST